MSSKDNSQNMNVIGKRERETDQIEINDCEDEKQLKSKENGVILMTYELDKNSIKNNKYISLLGKDFVKKNKNKCNLIISGKEYEIVSEINLGEFKKYDINEKDKTLEIKLKGKELEDISYIFYNCDNLIKIDLSSFNTQNITNMFGMFSDCINLIEINLSSFNTKNVTNMSYMFNNCKNLIELNLLSFNTENVTNMSSMFNGCENLTKLEISSFNTQNVKNMYSIFKDCKNLTKIDLQFFNTQNVMNMYGMFKGCENLIKADLSSFNTQNVNNIDKMFFYCDNLIKVDLSSFSTENITNSDQIFNGDRAEFKIKRKNFNKTKKNFMLGSSNLSIKEI